MSERSNTYDHEGRWLLKWALERWAEAEMSDSGETLEDMHAARGDDVTKQRFLRAVELSGYRPKADRVSEPCHHNEYVASIRPDGAGNLLECWGCGMRCKGDRVWVEV